MDLNEFVRPGPAAGSKAKYLVAHMKGALDAGSAGAIAVEHLTNSLGTQRVATFNSDQLLDFRSHRPVMTVEDWVTTGMSWPQIVIDLVHDDQGEPFLVLHGPEPDAKWGALTDAIAQIAEDAGVEAVFSLHGMPAAVPHTRPPTVHIQATEADLVGVQPEMSSRAQLPAPYTSFLQHRLRGDDRVGVTLLATVPYYMAAATFPRASSALLSRLGEMAGLSLPIGDLERGADVEAEQVDELVEQNDDLLDTVESLERHYDEIAATGKRAELDVEGATEGSPEDDWELVAKDSTQGFPEVETRQAGGALADVIGEAIEGYLRTQSKRKKPGEEPSGS